VVAALYMDYGDEIFMQWFIPSRISFFLISVVLSLASQTAFGIEPANIESHMNVENSTFKARA